MQENRKDDFMFGKLFDPTYKEFKKCSKVAEAVVALEDEYKLYNALPRV